MIGSATYGPSGESSFWRYTLRRDWTDELGLFADPERSQQHAMFLMLNPSKATATDLDPTVAKCLRLAKRWGFGALEVRNIFAYRSTDPGQLRKAADPVGPENDAAIRSCAEDPRTGLIVAAWGNHGLLKQRAVEVTRILKAVGKPVYCFRVSALDQPEHPLYQTECDLDGLVQWL